MAKVTIRQKDGIQEIRSRIRQNLRQLKALSAKRYSGTVRLKEEPLAYQRRMRQEWDEHSD